MLTPGNLITKCLTLRLSALALAASAHLQLEVPALTTRVAGVMVPGGVTNLFVDDVLVIHPGDGGPVIPIGSPSAVSMQYRVSRYQGAVPPTTDWQEARQGTWKGCLQWWFTLPCGAMHVEVRAVRASSGAPSEASLPLPFSVQGEPTQLESHLPSTCPFTSYHTN